MIVVAGEALVDMVPERTPNAATAAAPGGGNPALAPLHPRLGGGPFNVAIALGRLAVPVGFLSRVSTDPFGAALVERLEQSSVDTGLVQRGAEPTTLAVVGLTEDGSARYSFYVQGTADRLVTDPGPLPERVSAVSFGTLSLVLEPGASEYERIMRREHERGTLTALDPNIRTSLIPDADAYRRRFASWLPHVGLLKVSVEDASWLAEADLSDPDTARAVLTKWQQAGPSAVVLTRGGDGLSVLTGAGELVEVPAVPVTVVDTIGAGDTVQGALLAWLHRHGVLAGGAPAVAALDAGEWRSALAFAGAAAAITCSRAGAEPPYAGELAE
ncbi:carbohydrate kinase family protein [Goodfellowiella coeruleoviolacea]|uniref:Fructokinase n=1 Tax=Goodfellowiella coeruleoviolacea TaxID=334858 RepID=A0AAE3KJL2_9PSEU|nr:carbohydrate kinase [Goodfellowiella coeruleoviolacea]MCP2169207.1 fructokinase [Goodfellowiella coeruleoviolacea]